MSSFRTICGHVNPFTAAITYFAEPVEIHEDDLDWLLRMWDEGDALDWEIWRAVPWGKRRAGTYKRTAGVQPGSDH